MQRARSGPTTALSSSRRGRYFLGADAGPQDAPRAGVEARLQQVRTDLQAGTRDVRGGHSPLVDALAQRVGPGPAEFDVRKLRRQRLRAEGQRDPGRHHAALRASAAAAHGGNEQPQPLEFLREDLPQVTAEIDFHAAQRGHAAVFRHERRQHA